MVIVTPTSHIFVSHWLQFTSMCCLFDIGYFSGRTYLPPFAEFNHVCGSRWYSDNHLVDIYLRSDEAVNNIHRCTTPAGHGDIPVSLYWYYLRTDESVNNICCVQHRHVTLIYYTKPFLSGLQCILRPTDKDPSHIYLLIAGRRSDRFLP